MKRILVPLILVLVLVSCSPANPGSNSAPTLPSAQQTEVAQTVLSTLAAPPVGPTSTSTVEAVITPTQTITTPLATKLPVKAATAAPVNLGPENFPADVNPLTGLKVSDVKLLDRRPLGIKINIHPGYSRPPYGLSLADIVFEYYHQVGATRFHAIYYGQDVDKVGPIRSGRLLDDSLVQMYKSIFVYGGAYETIDARFMNSNYANRLLTQMMTGDVTCPATDKIPLCRFEPSGKDWLLGSTKSIHAYMQAKGLDDMRQNLNGMTFATAVPQNGTAVTSAITRYSWASYSKWVFDPASGRYQRLQDPAPEVEAPETFEPLIDQGNKQPILADNVVFVLAPHENANEPGSNQIVNIDINGTGAAYAMRDGKMYKLKWNRPTASSVLSLTYEDGKPYQMKPGITWFQVVDPQVKIKQDGEAWRFDQYWH